ncbi:PQQ-dependent sugar dehydrogenase [Sphingomonas sp. UNC305MFCol5.2]|uniref:PQQ-dependent sugar dehydrogenase n=1 Tax=Sphingomonas sp. UNC305MFCol5.2 TaxID=1449076 RepID=UPI00068DFDE3|nr:PQQ-dependent sugar dehydrogenase [Sphingomonas sp. UNC305MFCol5.2]
MRRAMFGSLLLLAACSSDGGGGGATPTPTPTPANSPPSFTSAATASVAENTTLAYQATASDPDGNPITFSVAGGADAARFAITAAGALSFVAAPNFELPTDADGNNVYTVQLAASDGTASSTLNLQVTVTNSREGIAVKRVGTGFDQPVDVVAVPGDNSRVLVAEKTGGVWFLTPATGVKTLAFRVTDLTTENERGLLGIAPSPNFATTSEVMIHMTGAAGTIFTRRCFVTSGGCTDILSIPHPTNANHNGGWIAWGPDGNLYVAVGDGGGAGDPNNNAQNPNSRLGKILRLARSGSGFVAAPGNPFVGGGGDPYVFALGLRNPFRNSFDGNRIIVADVGQSAIEELDLVRTDQPGLNFGWHYLEGTQPYTGTAPAGLTAPVSQYGHGSGPREGGSIIGGHVYRGPVTSLQGAYVFGDFISGNIWTLPAASLVQGSLFPSSSYERRNQDFAPDAGTIDQLVSFGLDGGGNLYIVDFAGEIFEVLPG